MEILAFSLADLWAQWLWPILLLLIGLGLVILVHELGHFAAAKLVGIRVERLAMGFGPRLLGFRKGETDYCLKLLPLGGYLKMAGQEDLQPLSEQAEPDPRAFYAKSVSARMLVISAGVVMNVIFAALLFIVVCLVGIQFTAPVIGSVADGGPADLAKVRWRNPPEGLGAESQGLKPGYKVLSLNGRAVSRFERLKVAAVLADKGETFDFEVERIFDGKPVTGTTRITVTRVLDERGAERLIFGVGPPVSLTFAESDDPITGSRIRPGDRLVNFAGRDVENSWELEAIAAGLLVPPGGLPNSVDVTVARPADNGGEEQLTFSLTPALRTRDVFFHRGERSRMQWARAAWDEEHEEKVTIGLPDGGERTYALRDVQLPIDFKLEILGMVPRLKVLKISKGSPAQEAGLEIGDVVVSYAEQRNLTLGRIREISEEYVKRQTSIFVIRGGQLLQKDVVPTSYRGSAAIGVLFGLDLGNPVVGAVLSGTAAEKARIDPGDAVVSIASPGDQAGAGEPEVAKIETWIDVFNALRDRQGERIVVSFESGRKIAIDSLTPAIFDVESFHVSTGRMLPPLEFLKGPEVQTYNPLAAVSWGVQETYDFILMSYATIRSWVLGTVSRKYFAGPVGIGGLAIRVGRESVIELVYFMAMISVSLAVINFLPLPVLDGGHAVFLIVEKIRRKPVPVKVMNVVQMIGLALILFVFIALTWNDIARIVSSWW